MDIVIWSDFVCPFCYIGEANLAKALATFDADLPVKIEYRSFQLHPEGTYQAGRTYAESLAQTKGMPLADIEASLERTQKMAAAAGVEIDYSRAIYANTYTAHRLFQAAKAEGLGNAFFQRFYPAYFAEGCNLEDPTVLSQLAQEVGLSDSLVTTVLEDPTAYDQAVRNDLMQAQSLGIRGVPFYVFANKYALNGAQPVEIFQQVIKQVQSEVN